jgi:hypothetical protein
MKTIIPILALSCIASVTSFARIGETEAECEARYGKSIATVQVFPDQLADSRKEYLKEGIKITIAFWKDRAIEVIYNIDSLRKVSQEGILTLLAANAGGSEWTLVEEPASPAIVQRGGRIRPNGASRWNRKDGLAKAFFDPNNGLSISDNAWQEALKTHKAALAAAASDAEKTRLKGF